MRREAEGEEEMRACICTALVDEFESESQWGIPVFHVLIRSMSAAEIKAAGFRPTH